MKSPSVTRLAPSPTGALHLGNARTFLVTWALARQRGWRIVLRIEDLDGPRIKPGAAEQSIDTLAWLGMDWDDGPTWQRADLEPYRAALRRLASAGAIYPCRCTRSQVLAASLSAPHAGDHELRYSGACRPAANTSVDFDDAAHGDAAWRLRAPGEAVAFDDALAGPQSHNVQQTVGDFVVATKARLPSYQLAVVVDDARQRVTRVVRGDDLLPSTPRQLLLYKRLELGPPPQHTHVPLVVGGDGKRLAKRHGDTRLDHYRRQGVRPERVIGLIAEWCGVGERTEMTAAELLARFELGQLPSEAIVFTPADDAWLLNR